MSSLISNSELTTQLELHIPQCEELNLISAFVTQPAIRWLEALVTINQPTINLVGRFSPQDFIAGASDISAIRTCLNSGYQVKALSNLHAKIYQIDRDIIFTGSANLTGKGLSLVEHGNLESCTRVNACDTSKDFIEKIINAAITITGDILNKMEAYLDLYSTTESSSIPASWPTEVIPKTTDLFVSDFPLTKPGETTQAYIKNPSLEFAIIEASNADFSKTQHLFKQSKSYQWLKAQVIKNQGNRDLGFGQVSRLLHDTLCDDPDPYRSDIKELLSALYSYIKIYASDDISVYIPGSRSQVLRLLGPSHINKER